MIIVSIFWPKLLIFYIIFLFSGVIRDIIEWKESRVKLYWRLRRRLSERKLMTKIEKTGSVLNHGQKTELLRRWFTESVKGQHR